MGLKLIKTQTIEGYEVTLFYLETAEEYEVQIYKVGEDTILDTDGGYASEDDGLLVHEEIVEEMKQGCYKNNCMHRFSNGDKLGVVGKEVCIKCVYVRNK